MRLRGHHLLCSLGFRGLGYSPGFVVRMTEVLATLAAAPHTEVLLTDEADVLCAAFPTDQPPHCGEQRVRLRDRAVLRRLGWAPGQVRAWQLIRQGLAQCFVPADIELLCASCPWRPLGYCAEGLERLRAESGPSPAVRPATVRRAPPGYLRSERGDLTTAFWGGGPDRRRG